VVLIVGGITVALIGTTVVPYNLFLHANLVQEKWHKVETATATREARRDTIVSIIIGGIITVAIVVTRAATLPARYY
jgi:Mn2+/Fe2+ NRAMP family transporter